jgi:hypothetical protein
MATTTRYVERQLVTRSERGDHGAAMELLESLPGIRHVCTDPGWDRFYVTFDPRVVTDDELLAALEQNGFELIGWQPAGIRGRAAEREWLLRQIEELTGRAEVELGERGEYAQALVKGAVDAYARTGRAFGLITDDEIRALIPRRFLEAI